MDTSTTVMALGGAIIAVQQVFQTIQIAILHRDVRDVRNSLRPPKFVGDEDDDEMTPARSRKKTIAINKEK